jgi:hypothetical protein
LRFVRNALLTKDLMFRTTYLPSSAQLRSHFLASRGH